MIARCGLAGSPSVLLVSRIQIFAFSLFQNENTKENAVQADARTDPCHTIQSCPFHKQRKGLQRDEGEYTVRQHAQCLSDSKYLQSRGK